MAAHLQFLQLGLSSSKQLYMRRKVIYEVGGQVRLPFHCLAPESELTAIL